MMMPSIFGENLFDSFFDDSFPFFYNDRDLKKAEKKLYGRKGDRMTKTDIREKQMAMNCWSIFRDLRRKRSRRFWITVI